MKIDRIRVFPYQPFVTKKHGGYGVSTQCQSLTQKGEAKLKIAADLVPLETAPKTIAASQNKLVFLLHLLMGLSPSESTQRIHRGRIVWLFSDA